MRRVRPSRRSLLDRAGSSDGPAPRLESYVRQRTDWAKVQEFNGLMRPQGSQAIRGLRHSVQSGRAISEGHDMNPATHVSTKAGLGCMYSSPLTANTPDTSSTVDTDRKQ